MNSTTRSSECIQSSPTQSQQRELTSFAVAQNIASTEARMNLVGSSRDTSDMRARLTSSHFVGRVGELAELELALRESADRRPVLVLLGGGSGVGKTRLVAEFERRREDDATTLRGEAVEQGEGELPYAPLLGALRPLVRERHPSLQALSSGSRAQLAALLPGLDDGGNAPRDRQDPAAQLRLFEALLELLDVLSDENPLVLILEDMHWSDRSTRTFVAFLARSLRQERVMLLLTYRTDELHRRHALRPLLSELERLDRARRLELEPFDRDELTEALSDILGADPSVELVERLFARSEGNPLYTEELLAAGLDGRGAAPQSLRDAFLLRIERLSPDAQRAARAIAVGRRLDEATLAELTGVEHLALHEALREAVAEQVLMTGEDGRFFFRHALLREAVYDDLLPGERGEMHLALARFYESRPVGDDDREVERATTIASHYASAGDQPAALRATVRAALAARDVRAYGEVADLAERALELWPRVSEEQRSSELDHVDLLTLAASAQVFGGDRGRSEVLLQSALAELDPDADPHRYAGLLERLARVQWNLNRGLQGVETAQRALAMLPSDDTSEERAALLAWLARTRFLRGRFRDALADGELALAAAIAAGDRCGEGEVLNTLGMTQVALGRVEQGIERLRNAVEIARDIDDLDGLGTAYSNLADTLNMVGRTREALEVAREGLAVVPRRMSRVHDWITLTVSELSYTIGDWDAAWDHLGPAPAQLSGVLLMFRLLREAENALGVGDNELARRCLSDAAPLVSRSSEPQWISGLGVMLGELYRRERDLPAARRAIADALDRIEVCTDDVMRIARVSAEGVRVEADFAQRARDLREKRDEREAITRAKLHVDRLRAAAQEGGPVERAWSSVGAAELARARGRNDPKLWAKAAAQWEALERPYLIASMRWRESEAYVEAGNRSDAAQAARAALEIAGNLGAKWLRDEVTALSERARLPLEEELEPTVNSEGNGAPPDPFGLTPRERQVLALIAEGATNRQIGAALYMAEKTASVHVSRILAKLGVQSRTQAAAVAHRMHLSA
jgi:DNA-binding CsgD family transcriptional regulator/tetratricopeptide (TPR) repeat protein